MGLVGMKKLCSKCKQEKDVFCFCKSSIQKSGLNPSCKECNKERHRKYRMENKEKISRWHKEYRNANPERCKIASAKSHIKHRDKIHAKQKEYRSRNKEVASNRNKKRYQKQKHNPEFLCKQRESFLKRHYDITIQDYDDMYIEQGGCCAICGTHQSELSRRLDIDHCHEKEIVRGLLCHKCNVGIGHFDNNIELLKNATKYLEMAGK